MMGAIKYVATIEYGWTVVDFEFYTIDEAAKFAGTVLKHYKPGKEDAERDVKVYLSIITDDIDETDDMEEEE